ncbi:MAG TPA: AAA family ATPase [Candidatus Woesearchaeota archaeon]|nr:AAA family ATPase [Candidatus Woesearchaeota archaeon]
MSIITAEQKDKKLSKDYFSDFIGDSSVCSDLKRAIDYCYMYDFEFKQNPASPFPNRMLFYGPPGTGKSLLARLSLKYFLKKGDSKGLSPDIIYIDSSFKDKYYGESERKIRDMFSRFNSTESISMMIIDEIDTLFPSRGITSSSADFGVCGEILKSLEGILNENTYNNILISTSNMPREFLDDALVERISQKVVYLDYFESKSQYQSLAELVLNNNKIDKSLFNLESDIFQGFFNNCLSSGISQRRAKAVFEAFLFYAKDHDLSKIPDKAAPEEIRKHLYRKLSQKEEQECLDKALKASSEL